MRNLVIIVILSIITGCCKENDICNENLNIRFENQTNIELLRIKFASDDLSIKKNNLNDDYLQIPDELFKDDNVRLIATTSSNYVVGTNIDLPNEIGCYTLNIIDIDTLNVFADTTLFYELIKN